MMKLIFNNLILESEPLNVVNVFTEDVIKYPGGIEAYIDNAFDEFYSGNIALPYVEDKYVSDEAHKAIKAYKQMLRDCLHIADKQNKRGLIVYLMCWNSACAYTIKAFDAINGHRYTLKRFKSYGNSFDIIDDATGESLNSDRFYAHIDWKFCNTYFIPLERDIYELRTPIDDRDPSPVPINANELSYDKNRYPELIKVIDYINKYRQDPAMDEVVNRRIMYLLELRFNRFFRFMVCDAPNSIIDREYDIILKAFNDL